MTLIDNLPSSNDHNSGRLIFGPDQKLYYTIGDQGANQSSNYCNPNLAQVLPTQQEIDQEDWSNYPGKILRLNTDGSIQMTIQRLTVYKVIFIHMAIVMLKELYLVQMDYYTQTNMVRIQMMKSILLLQEKLWMAQCRRLSG